MFLPSHEGRCHLFAARQESYPMDAAHHIYDQIDLDYLYSSHRKAALGSNTDLDSSYHEKAPYSRSNADYLSLRIECVYGYAY